MKVYYPRVGNYYLWIKFSWTLATWVTHVLVCRVAIIIWYNSNDEYSESFHVRKNFPSYGNAQRLSHANIDD